ncbi:hypothetical protein BESB_079890 [Besnoitia besnoiti]|uniref:Uncharacterized protein n=1 Tax=Besnoitia besnoiti TaxID=94643 RepID=A0A2A9MDL3_BESBE|nr:hypothetical protein BESB_079890 [Besnoitia besnoiti]PFH33773.1 hypothetical protein BESB_079890 [Besnoitia besnoiti]
MRLPSFTAGAGRFRGRHLSRFSCVAREGGTAIALAHSLLARTPRFSASAVPLSASEIPRGEFCQLWSQDSRHRLVAAPLSVSRVSLPTLARPLACSTGTARAASLSAHRGCLLPGLVAAPSRSLRRSDRRLLTFEARRAQGPEELLRAARGRGEPPMEDAAEARSACTSARQAARRARPPFAGDAEASGVAACAGSRCARLRRLARVSEEAPVEAWLKGPARGRVSQVKGRSASARGSLEEVRDAQGVCDAPPPRGTPPAGCARARPGGGGPRMRAGGETAREGVPSDLCRLPADALLELLEMHSRALKDAPARPQLGTELRSRQRATHGGLSSRESEESASMPATLSSGPSPSTRRSPSPTPCAESSAQLPVPASVSEACVSPQLLFQAMRELAARSASLSLLQLLRLSWILASLQLDHVPDAAARSPTTSRLSAARTAAASSRYSTAPVSLLWEARRELLHGLFRRLQSVALPPFSSSSHESSFSGSASSAASSESRTSCASSPYQPSAVASPPSAAALDPCFKPGDASWAHPSACTSSLPSALIARSVQALAQLLDPRMKERFPLVVSLVLPRLLVLFAHQTEREFQLLLRRLPHRPGVDRRVSPTTQDLPSALSSFPASACDVSSPAAPQAANQEVVYSPLPSSSSSCCRADATTVFRLPKSPSEASFSLSRPGCAASAAFPGPEPASQCTPDGSVVILPSPLSLFARVFGGVARLNLRPSLACLARFPRIAFAALRSPLEISSSHTSAPSSCGADPDFLSSTSFSPDSSLSSGGSLCALGASVLDSASPPSSAASLLASPSPSAWGSRAETPQPSLRDLSLLLLSLSRLDLTTQASLLLRLALPLLASRVETALSIFRVEALIPLSLPSAGPPSSADEALPRDSFHLDLANLLMASALHAHLACEASGAIASTRGRSAGRRRAGRSRAGLGRHPAFADVLTLAPSRSASSSFTFAADSLASPSASLSSSAAAPCLCSAVELPRPSRAFTHSQAPLFRPAAAPARSAWTQLAVMCLDACALLAVTAEVRELAAAQARNLSSSAALSASLSSSADCGPSACPPVHNRRGGEARNLSARTTSCIGRLGGWDSPGSPHSGTRQRPSPSPPSSALVAPSLEGDSRTEESHPSSSDSSLERQVSICCLAFAAAPAVSPSRASGRRANASAAGGGLRRPPRDSSRFSSLVASQTSTKRSAASARRRPRRKVPAAPFSNPLLRSCSQATLAWLVGLQRRQGARPEAADRSAEVEAVSAQSRRGNGRRDKAEEGVEERGDKGGTGFEALRPSQRRSDASAAGGAGASLEAGHRPRTRETKAKQKLAGGRRSRLEDEVIHVLRSILPFSRRQFAPSSALRPPAILGPSSPVSPGAQRGRKDTGGARCVRYESGAFLAPDISCNATVYPYTVDILLRNGRCKEKELGTGAERWGKHRAQANSVAGA